MRDVNAETEIAIKSPGIVFPDYKARIPIQDSR